MLVVPTVVDTVVDTVEDMAPERRLRQPSHVTTDAKFLTMRRTMAIAAVQIAKMRNCSPVGCAPMAAPVPALM